MSLSRRHLSILAFSGILLSTALPAPMAALGVNEVLVPEATAVELRLEQALSSASATTNLPILFRVQDDVVIDGRTVIEEGALARGTVTRAQHRKGFGRRGKLEFTIDVVEAIDGQNLRLRASQSLKGKDLYGTAGVVTILTGPFGVFVKGKDVEVPAGTEYTIYTDSDRRIRVPGDRG